MHLTDDCRFLNCSVRMGIKGVEGWEGGGLEGGNMRGGGGVGWGERCVMNHNGPLGGQEQVRYDS